MQQRDRSAGRTLVTHRTLEIVAALLALAFGARSPLARLSTMSAGANAGPSLATFRSGWAWWSWSARSARCSKPCSPGRLLDQPAAINADQARRIAVFVLPMLGFLIVTVVFRLGLYVGTVAYLLAVMLWQGAYRLPAALAVSFGTAIVFFMMFEWWLKVPLMQGPIEAWLGIH